MLTREEAEWSLKVFRVFSILNLFPIQVDVKSGKIQKQSSRVKVFMWKILFGVAITHWLYTFGRFVQSTILEREKYFRWDHFVIHFCCTWAYAAFHFTGFLLFVKYSEENVIIFNQLFEQRADPVQRMIDQQLQSQIRIKLESGKILRGKSGAPLLLKSAREPHENKVVEKPQVCPLPRPLLTWPPQYSLDELVAKLFPALVLFSEVFIVLVLALDPTRPQLLYSVLPPKYQNYYSFFSLLLVEVFCMVIIGFTASVSIVTQVLFFSKCQLEMQRLDLQLRNLEEKFQTCLFRGRDIQREIWILHQILKELKELVSTIELFNRCFPFCIFSVKICFLSLSIVCYFFFIRHHEDFPFLAFLFGYGAVVMTVVYTVLYGHAFSIPETIERLKHEFLLTAQNTISESASSNGNANMNKILRAEMQREIKRLHDIGIKVGSFHQMERESTLTFIDFVVKNVVNLLVTFPR